MFVNTAARYYDQYNKKNDVRTKFDIYQADAIISFVVEDKKSSLKSFLTRTPNEYIGIRYFRIGKA